MPNADYKPFHFGFQFGVGVAYMDLTKADAFLTDTALVAVEPLPTAFYSLGLVVNAALPDEHWDLRFTPAVAFYDRQTRFAFRDGSEEVSSALQTVAELPLMVRYKSSRRGNHRMFVVAGLSPTLEIATRYERGEDRLLAYRGAYLEAVYGFGFDGYAEFFRFVPEIRFSHGLTDLLRGEEGLLARNLQRGLTHRIALLINFEG